MAKIIGNTVGMGLPKPDLMQSDPTKGDYIKGKDEFLREFGNGSGAGVPAGGKKGQVLCKMSDADGDVGWADPEIPEEYGLITYDQDRTITIT